MTNQRLWERIGGFEPHIRAADADRERIAERLRKGHAEGRIDMDEFQQRLESCYASRTLGELRNLVGDLPRQDEHPAPRSLTGVGFWRRRLSRLAPILIAVIVVSTAAGHHILWLWPLLAFLVWRTSCRRRRRWLAAARRGASEWV